MAALVLGVAGAAIGGYLSGGNPQAIQAGFAVGSYLGGYYATVSRKIEGPKLNDLRFTGTEYGECIPYVLASPRISGQIWWASEKRPVAHETGGKGGEPQVTQYTYEIDLLVGLTINEIENIGRIWFNGKLVYRGIDRTDLWRRMTVYTGDAAQDPDPTYEAAVGAGNAPAYRGRGSVFFEGLQLDGNGQLPVMTFELNTAGLMTLSAVSTQIAIGDGVSGSLSNGYQEAPTSDSTFGVGTAYLARVSITPTTPSSDSGKVLQLYVTVDSFEVWRGSVELDGSSVTQILRYQIHISGHDSTVVRIGYELSDGVTGSISYGLISLTGATVYGPAASGDLSAPGDTYFGVLVDGSGNYRYADYSSIWGSSVGPPTVLDASISLQDAVEAICTRAGMGAGDFDASALSTITQPVRGIALAQIEPVRGILDQLRSAYLFDAYLTDKLYFVPRGGSVVRTLTYGEIGAGFDTSQDEPLPVTTANDLELPPQVAVQYRNAANDYQVGTEYSDRLISGQVAAQVVQFGLGLLPEEAKKAADTIVVEAHAGIVSTQFATGVEHTDLVPSDVVQVTDRNGKLLRVRIMRRQDDGGVIQFDGVRDDAGAIASESLTDDGYNSQDTVTVLSETEMLLLDIPLLRDEDDAPGYYVAARGESAKWGGAEVFSSANDVDFTNVVTVRESAVLGTCRTTLANFAGGSALIDSTNTVTVNVAHGTLASSTEAAMFADATINVMLIGSEVIRFVTATASDTDPNIYVLSRLFRGQQGTEWAISGHASGERCCLLRPRGLRKIDSTDIGATRYIKGVTFGLAAADVDAEAFVNTGVLSKPWSPVNVQQAKSGSDYTIIWDRRSRLSTRFASSAGISVPLGEESERYEVDLYNGSTLVDTFETTTASVDFSGSYTGYTVTVYQLSGVVGRGYASAALTLY